ncbi:MAG TPA: rhomboid family intramembrane serine protease, partial [Rhodocyclaceae bacterium]|nr:rhomboid family intramembrane serine protease [Rhodocyclaceae bacterium]
MIYLTLILVASFVASALASGAWWDIPATELLAQGASFGPAVAGGESWRLVSALFLHGGVLHLLFNDVALIEIGRAVEQRIGSARTLALFLLAGAWGFLASLLWHPEAISIGASGGIFGLLGVWAMLVSREIGQAAAANRRRRQLSVFLAVLLALGLGLLIPNVDHAAHHGGLAVGLLGGGLIAAGQRRWPVFFAWALVLAGGLWVATTQLPASWQIEYVETHDYALRYRQFAEEDRQISAALVAIGEASRQNRLSDVEGLAQLDRELLPRLARLAAGWRERSWQTPRLARDAGRWTTYTQLRLDAVTALRD